MCVNKLYILICICSADKIYYVVQMDNVEIHVGPLNRNGVSTKVNICGSLALTQNMAILLDAL
jgi:hypothetical protein